MSGRAAAGDIIRCYSVCRMHRGRGGSGNRGGTAALSALCRRRRPSAGVGWSGKAL